MCSHCGLLLNTAGRFHCLSLLASIAFLKHLKSISSTYDSIKMGDNTISLLLVIFLIFFFPICLAYIYIYIYEREMITIERDNRWHR